jgi:hypothetical protein
LLNASIMWNTVVLAFPVVGNWLVWQVRNGNKVRIGEDPWAGCGQEFKLPVQMIHQLG